MNFISTLCELSRSKTLNRLPMKRFLLLTEIFLGSLFFSFHTAANDNPTEIAALCGQVNLDASTRHHCANLINPPIIKSDNVTQGASDSTQIWPFSKPKDEEISIILLGDTNISYRQNPESAFLYLTKTLKEADVVFANLEGPFAGGTNDPKQSDAPGKDWRHSNANQVEALVAAGIDTVGTANNVTLPPDAALRSMQVLNNAGIKQTGTGSDKAQAEAAIVVERNGIKIGFLQRTMLYEVQGQLATKNTPGIAGVEIKTRYELDTRINKPGRPPFVKTFIAEDAATSLAENIKSLKERADIVVVSYHWGLSDAVQLVGYEREVAHLSIDAGADVVLGHGTHRLKPIEVYKGKAILYDLGQSIFDDRRNFDQKKGGTRSARYPEGLMAYVKANKKGIVGIELGLLWRDTYGDDQLRLYLTNSDIGQQVLSDLLFRSNVAYTRLPIEIKQHYLHVKLN